MKFFKSFKLGFGESQGKFNKTLFESYKAHIAIIPKKNYPTAPSTHINFIPESSGSKFNKIMFPSST